MPRGGINSGTLPPTWLSGRTTVIRVPYSRKVEIIELARVLDQIPSKCTLVTQSDLSQALALLHECLILPANRGVAIKDKIRTVIDLLQTK